MWRAPARDDDFVGVQNYERIHDDGTGAVPVPDDVARNQMGSAVEPESLVGAVRYAYEVAQVPVLVTEHGMSTSDDALRAGFLEPSLSGLLDAISDGVPVLGYLHWTLMDNFEWIFGYGHQLGLYEVDRPPSSGPRSRARGSSRTTSAGSVRCADRTIEEPSAGQRGCPG